MITYSATTVTVRAVRITKWYQILMFRMINRVLTEDLYGQEDKNDDSQQTFDMCHVDSMMMVGFCLVFELAQKEFLRLMKCC